jgi:hypothetical protein
VGIWKIDADRSLRDISEIPRGLSREFADLDAYRAYLKPKIAGGEFEIHGDETAVFKRSDGFSQEMTWEKQGEKYWVGNHAFMSFSVGHIFEIGDGRTGICKFQMEYSESVAPRSPLYVTKVND